MSNYDLKITINLDGETHVFEKVSLPEDELFSILREIKKYANLETYLEAIRTPSNKEVREKYIFFQEGDYDDIGNIYLPSVVEDIEIKKRTHYKIESFKVMDAGAKAKYRMGGIPYCEFIESLKEMPDKKTWCNKLFKFGGDNNE